MEDLTRKFILDKTRSKRGVIVDAVGNLGNWPFRRTISYNVGVNCDAIEAGNGYLRVLRRGRTIAIAELPPAGSLLVRLFRRIGELLHPRHATSQYSSARWEDLLHPRRPK